MSQLFDLLGQLNSSTTTIGPMAFYSFCWWAGCDSLTELDFNITPAQEQLSYLDTDPNAPAPQLEEGWSSGAGVHPPPPPNDTASDTVHQTFYSVQADDDDNTFVDHGSTSMSVLPASAGLGAQGHRTFASFSSPAPPKPPMPTREPPRPAAQETYAPQQAFRPAAPVAPSLGLGLGASDALRASSGQAPPLGPLGYGSTVWNPPRVVSQMSMEQGVRTMTVAPDGKSLWLAIGDDPLTVLDVDGTDLVVSKSMDFVTKVYCVAVVTVPGMQHTRFKSMPSAEEDGGEENKEDTYFMWCGLSKGHISIVDLQQCAEAGIIRNAHSQTLHRIWHLPNGKVWTSGLDKAVKVWDPQTRRKLKNRNIAAILVDLCYVPDTKEVWGIAGDNTIRVFESGGDNARVNKQSGENTLKMKNEVLLLKYCEDANLVWAASTKGTSLMDPGTYEIACHINITLSSLAFHKKTAIVTGHGPLLECDIDSVAVLDITNPQQPSLLFLGSQMEGVMPFIGMHLFTATPLAIVAQDEGRYQKKSLTVFTYEETLPIGKYNPLQGDLPQRRISGNFRGVPPLLNSMRQNFGSFALSNESATHGGESSQTGVGRDEVQHHGPATRPEVHGGLTRPQQQAALAASPVMLSLLEDIALSSKETRNIIAALHHSQAPVLDFAKLQGAAATWAMRQGPGTLPALDREESEAIEHEYSTAEGKALATMLAQLQKAASAKLGQGYFRGPPLPQGAAAHLNFSRSSSNSAMGEATEQTLRSPPRFTATTRFQAGGGGGGATSEPAAGTSNGDTALLHQLLSQLSRSGCAEKATFQHQIQVFQQYNKRLVDRQNALVSAFARIDQVVRTFAQQVEEELLSAAAEAKDPAAQAKAQQQQLQAAALSNAVQSLRAITPSSHPREVHELVSDVTALLSKSLLIHSSLLSGPGLDRRAIGLDVPPPPPPPAPAPGSTTDHPSPHCRTGGEAGRHSCLLPGEASRIPIESLLLSPKRLLQRVGEELGRLMAFLQRAELVWSRTEDLRRVAYAPYEDGQTPDLGEDFMQFAPLLDLQEANLMLDICRLEGFLSVAESLLDKRDEAIFVALGGSLQRVSRSESDMTEFRERAAAELRTLVDATIAVETFSSRVRSSIARWREGVAAPLAEHVGRHSGGFFSFGFPLNMDRTKIDGSIYWAHLCLALLTQCMEAVESIMYPVSEPVHIERSNFTLITKKLVEWEGFIKEVERRSGHMQFILTVPSLESDAARRQQEQQKSTHRHESKPSKKAREEQRGQVLRALEQWNFSALRSYAEAGDVVPATEAAPAKDGKAELSLHHILLFLFLQDLQSQQEGGVASGDIYRVLGISSASVSRLTQKAQQLLTYNATLQQRARDLVSDTTVEATEVATGLLVAPLPGLRPDEIFPLSLKSFCKTRWAWAYRWISPCFLDRVEEHDILFFFLFARVASVGKVITRIYGLERSVCTALPNNAVCYGRPRVAVSGTPSSTTCCMPLPSVSLFFSSTLTLSHALLPITAQREDQRFGPSLHMNTARLLLEQINLEDYPLYANTPRTSDVPGLVLLEQYAVQGVRMAVPVGGLLTTAYFYLVLRPRLPFADRPLARLHYYLCPSAAYATPIGAVGGVMCGVSAYASRSSPDQLEQQLRQQQAGAHRALELRHRRRDAVLSRAHAQQTWWDRMRVQLGLLPDPALETVARAGLAREVPWESFLQPYSLAWVTATSRLHDSDGTHSTTESSPTNAGRFSQLEVHHLVSQAMWYRLDPTNDRWTITAGRGATAGCVTCLLYWKTGGRLFRASMGLGLGIFAASLVSAAKLDDIFTHLS
eukprot:gene4299-3115_t